MHYTYLHKVYLNICLSLGIFFSQKRRFFLMENVFRSLKHGEEE